MISRKGGMTATAEKVETTADQQINADKQVRHIVWNIESYENLFICGMLDDNFYLEMFYRVPDDHPEYVAEIDRACHDRGFRYKLYDLAKDISRFKWHFEKHIPASGKPTLLADFLGEAD